ncbi:reverse transcriptase from mobile element jockey protein [Salix suchowensis]|nr:reverse transcriptase from mobile element jockey protein [Salix suchowensis]
MDTSITLVHDIQSGWKKGLTASALAFDIKGVWQKGVLNQMAKVQNTGLQLILGTFQTSPVTALHHICAILPIPLLLKCTITNAAVHLQTLPRHAQPVVQLTEPWNNVPAQGPTASKSRRKKPTNLQLLTNWVGFSLSIDKLSFSDYVPCKRDARNQLICNIYKFEDEAKGDPTVINMFTDSSRHLVSGKHQTGAAFTAFYLGKEISKGLLGLGAHSNNYDGEIFTLTRTSQSIPGLLHEQPQVQQVWLFVDNTSAITFIYDTSPHPSQDA